MLSYSFKTQSSVQFHKIRCNRLNKRQLFDNVKSWSNQNPLDCATSRVTTDTETTKNPTISSTEKSRTTIAIRGNESRHADVYKQALLSPYNWSLIYKLYRPDNVAYDWRQAPVDRYTRMLCKQTIADCMGLFISDRGRRLIKRDKCCHHSLEGCNQKNFGECLHLGFHWIFGNF